MRRRQVVVYEPDGLLAELLRGPLRELGAAVVEARHASALADPPLVAVLRLGSDLAREIEMLENLHTNVPEPAIVVVCDSEPAALPDLAWELGARLVLPAAEARDLLPETVAALLTAPPTPPEASA